MLKISNIRKSFNENLVLDNINITINDGEIVGLLGPNGAGKTTLIKTICQLISPDNGDIKLDGNNINMGDINVVFEGVRNMYWPLTVKENYYYLAALKGVFKKKVDWILENDMKYSNVIPFLNKPFGELSLGQKQIVAIMSSLLSSPKLLCLDEPSNGLDINYQISLIDIIENYCTSSEKNVLISSHDLDFLYKTVNRFIIISEGKIIDEFSNKDITFEEIEKRYKNRLTWRDSNDTCKDLDS